MKHNILYFSHYPWSEKGSRYINLASALNDDPRIAELVYINPIEYPNGPGSLLATMIRGGRPRELRKSPMRVFGIVPPVFFRDRIPAMSRVFDRWADGVLQSLRFRNQSCRPAAVIVGASDFNLKVMRHFNERGVTTVFDWADHYEKHAAPPEVREKVGGICRELAANADIVLCVSPIVTEIASKYNDKSYLLPNAASLDMIVEDAEGVGREKGDRPPVICYYGVINPVKLDYPLIREVAGRKPDWHFVFIGPENDPLGSKEKLQEGNIEIRRPMNKKELGDFIAANADVCIAPYNMNDEAGKAGSAVKLYETMGFGLPFVSTDLFDPLDASDLIEIVKNADEMVEAIENELAGDNAEKRKARIEFARANTWNRRSERLIGLLE